MNNVDILIKALRTCNKPKGHRCSECPVFSRYPNRVCKSTIDKQAADALEQLKSENISLRAERDALLKSFTVTSKPIEVIQPKGLVE